MTWHYQVACLTVYFLSSFVEYKSRRAGALFGFLFHPLLLYLGDSMSNLWWTQWIKQDHTAKYRGKPLRAASHAGGTTWWEKLSPIGQPRTVSGHLRKSLGILVLCEERFLGVGKCGPLRASQPWDEFSSEVRKPYARNFGTGIREYLRLFSVPKFYEIITGQVTSFLFTHFWIWSIEMVFLSF